MSILTSGWLRPAVLLCLPLGAALLAPRAHAQGTPPPGTPGARPAIPLEPTFNPDTRGAAYPPSPDIATLGRAVPPPPTYVNAPSYNPPPIVTPSYGGGYGGGGYGYGYGYGYPVRQARSAQNLNAYSNYLSGAATLTSATGQYWQDIESARVTREQSRQASLDTKYKQLQLELEYEKYRVTAPKIRDARMATDLDWARKDPPATEIWSGATLNTLYNSVLRSATGPGPSIPLDDEVRRGINLTSKTARGSVGLLKDAGKLEWPEALLDSRFDEPRKSLDKEMQEAAATLGSGKRPDRALLKQIKDDADALATLIDANLDSLSPSESIGARRYVGQIRDTQRALSNATLVKTASTRLPSSVQTVGDLVMYMSKSGLEFAPAVAPGDETAYTTLYHSLRAFEMSVVASR